MVSTCNIYSPKLGLSTNVNGGQGQHEWQLGSGGNRTQQTINTAQSKLQLAPPPLHALAAHRVLHSVLPEVHQGFVYNPFSVLYNLTQAKPSIHHKPYLTGCCTLCCLRSTIVLSWVPFSGSVGRHVPLGRLCQVQKRC
jgi:hypothetical protein